MHLSTVTIGIPLSSSVSSRSVRRKAKTINIGLCHPHGLIALSWSQAFPPRTELPSYTRLANISERKNKEFASHGRVCVSTQNKSVTPIGAIFPNRNRSQHSVAPASLNHSGS
jgi:hypothetical protein